MLSSVSIPAAHSMASNALPDAVSNAANNVAGNAIHNGAPDGANNSEGNVANRAAGTLLNSVASCFSLLTAPCRRSRTTANEAGTGMRRAESGLVPVSAWVPGSVPGSVSASVPVPMSMSAPISALAPPLSLPTEIWGEIASLSARHDILNLRTTCRHVRSEADRFINTLTVTGTDNLYALADSSGFEHIHQLRLFEVDDASLYYFARSLHLRPPTSALGLSLIAQQSDIGTVQGAYTLCAMPLARLTLTCLHNLNRHTVEALKVCRFPITLVGQFSNAELDNLARIPTLTTLNSASEKFSDEAASLLASHPALHTLSIRAFQNLSDNGIQRIASAPQLRHLSLYETDYMSTRMTDEGAWALASCKTLTYLRIQTSVTPLSEASFAALATSTSLETLDVSISPGVRHIGNMRSLNRLTLRGRCLGSGPLDVASARTLAQMPQLQSLSMECTEFAPRALALTVQDSHLRHLHLQQVPFTQDALTAIMGNHHLVSLTLQSVDISREQITALSFHTTLQNLRINYRDYAPQPAPDSVIAYV